MDHSKIFLAAIVLKDLVLKVVSGHYVILPFGNIYFWQLKRRFRLISVQAQALRRILTAHVRFVTLLYGLSVVVAEFVVRQLLF